MAKILEYIASETSGQSYTSYKYCYDGANVPSVAYDEKVGDKKISLKKFGETDHSATVRDLSRRAKLLMDRKVPPLFRFFLDGSRKVYKIDDIEYGNKKIYPIIAGQISVACCERVDRSNFRKASLESYVVLSLPDIANANGHSEDLYFQNLANKINELEGTIRKGITIEKIRPYSSQMTEEETLENKGIAQIQDEMVDCEKKIVAYLASKNLLNEDSYLIKDGTLQYKPMKTGDYREISKIKDYYKRVVGVSKSFNPELMRDKLDKSNAATIAKLPLFHRTPAYMFEPDKSRFGDVKFAVWYVRIREAKHTNTPFAGILKIEKILVSDTEIEKGLDTDEIDMITANIINERNPVCYGSDMRWANHLYPVYLTEKFCKSQFKSDIQFINLF